MIDHIGLKVRNMVAATHFYDGIFAALGTGRCYSDPDLIGYGAHGQAFFWLHHSKTVASAAHVAFAAPDHRAVEAFHRAGLAAGGSDNGAPGPRPDYGPSYFAAFLLDPEGNNVEAVCNKKTT